jgi:hypothetical protein
MKRRWQIAFIAILALMVRSVGFCAVRLSCCASACPANDVNGCCDHHSQHPGPGVTHECCHSAICVNKAEFTANKDDSSVGPLQAYSPVVLHSIGPAESPTGLLAFAQLHAPPSPVPIFLSTLTLLI